MIRMNLDLMEFILGAYVINLDENADVMTHWLYYIIILLILKVLNLSTFLKKFKNLLEIKT